MPTIIRARRAALRARALKAVKTRRANAAAFKMTEAQFNRLPKEKQRILLALDVLGWIRTEKVCIASGTYLEHDTSIASLVEADTLQANSPAGQECLLNNGCTVCAKGAVFMAHVMRANKATVGDVLDANISSGTRLIRDFKVFTKKQYSLIECAFETSVSFGRPAGLLHDVDYRGNFVDTPWGEMCHTAVRFGCEYHASENRRMAAIMINMVEHNGTFVPKDNVTIAHIEEVLDDPTWGREFVNL